MSTAEIFLGTKHPLNLFLFATVAWMLWVCRNKNSARGGMTAPAVLCDREDHLTPANKIPELLLHPYTAAP